MLPFRQPASQPASQGVSQIRGSPPGEPSNIEQLHQNALTVLGLCSWGRSSKSTWEPLLALGLAFAVAFALNSCHYYLESCSNLQQLLLQQHKLLCKNFCVERQLAGMGIG